MTTSTPTRKTEHPEKAWTANISRVFNGVAALNLTSVEGKRVEHFGYYIEALSSLRRGLPADEVPGPGRGR
jgi:hypothetical protein